MTHQDSRGTVCECFKGVNTGNWPSAQLVGLWILDDTGMNNEFLMVILTQKLNSINCAFSDKHQICLSVQGYHSFLSQICFNHANLASSCFLLVHIHDENNSFSECEIMLRFFTHNESFAEHFRIFLHDFTFASSLGLCPKKHCIFGALQPKVLVSSLLPCVLQARWRSVPPQLRD